MDTDSWADIIYNIYPLYWAYIGTGLVLAFSIIGAAWYRLLGEYS